MLQGMTALLTKIEFLDNVSEFFPRYFDETFEATLLRNNGFVLNDDEQSSKVNRQWDQIWQFVAIFCYVVTICDLIQNFTYFSFK
jgi:hypothetical protein